MPARGVLRSIAVAALFAAGCSSAPYSSDLPLAPGDHAASSGVFRYRIPRGWVDASAESSAPRRVVMLLRADRRASIVAEQPVMDEHAMRTVHREGTCAVAAVLRDAAPGVEATGDMQEFEASGRSWCAWEGRQRSDGRAVRTAVAAAGRGVVEVRAVGPPGAARRDAEEVFQAQQAFLENLRW